MNMKLPLRILTGMAIASTVVPAQTAERYDADRPAIKSDQRLQIDRTERITHPAKASEIIGKEVNNLLNEKLGKVDELAVDVESGRVALVIINTGGVLGVGGKTVAVPPQSLLFKEGSKALQLNTDSAKLKAAPTFEMSKWKETSNTNQLTETYRYYGVQPYFAETRSNVNVTMPARPFRLEKASKVIGMSVVNKEDKKCGEVNNLIVDLPMNRIVHVVISSGGFLGVGDALNAVPPSALRYNASGDSLVLNLSKEELTRAPSFKSSEWPEFRDPTYSAKVYRSYGVDPYFSTDADNTARNVRDRQENRLTPLDQGTTDADVQMTRRIRQEILARDGLSVNARNVKIITVNGRVTLRGPVNDEAEKQIITEIVNRIAQSANVDNQTEVKREP